MKLLIVGLGSIGRRHLRNLRALRGSEIEVHACRSGEGAAGAEEDGVRIHHALESALAEEPDAVLVCNPTALHVPVARAAAEAGCHLFIEKPLSHTREGVEDLRSTIAGRRLRVLVGFQYRFHPGLGTVRRLIVEEAVGALVSAEVRWSEYLPDWHPAEDYRRGYSARRDLGGGVILTLCHPFDYLRWLLGEVRSVTAMAGRRTALEIDVEDTADVALELASGAQAAVHLDYAGRPREHGLRIRGQGGTIAWDEGSGGVRCYRADRGAWEEIPEPAGFERNAMFIDEMAHFLECVEGRAAPRVTLDDGVRALEIALAARRSAAGGRAVEVADG